MVKIASKAERDKQDRPGNRGAVQVRIISIQNLN